MSDKKGIKFESVDEFIARGGKVKKCMTYEINKYSSIPKAYSGQGGLNRGDIKNGRVTKKQGIDAQTLLDAAHGTKDEEAVIKFLESQGYEVE